MDITPFVEEMSAGLRLALSADTELDQAERLSNAVEAPARLALMGAVSQAATEASATLPDGRVAVQLAGPELVVSFEPGLSPAPPYAADDDEVDADGQARLTLRLPASLKTKAEQAATTHGISLNTWIIRVLREAVVPSDFDIRIGSAGLRLKTGSRQQKGWV